MIAPAARSRATEVASSLGRLWAKGRAPAVVGSPATWKISFTATGIPCTGPRTVERFASSARSRAAAKAPFSSTCTHACTLPSSARIRPRHASTSDTGLTAPRRISAAASTTPSAESSGGAIALRLTEGIQHLGDDLEAPERGHEVDAGVAAADLAYQALGHLDADLQRAVARVSEARADLVGDRDARHLIVEELGVAVAVEREHADDDRNRRAARLLEEPVEHGQVVHRLRLDPLRPGVHLAVETADLPLDVLGPRVQRRADAERGRHADAVAGRIQALIHPLQDRDEADGVDVEDGRGLDIVARARRVALEGEDVTDVEGVGPEQGGLDAHEVPVSTGEVHVDVEPRRLADEERRGEDRPPPAPERALVYIDDLLSP